MNTQMQDFSRLLKISALCKGALMCSLFFIAAQQARAENPDSASARLFGSPETYQVDPAPNIDSNTLYAPTRLHARQSTEESRRRKPRIDREEQYTEIFRDDFDGNSLSSNFFVPHWQIPNRATVNNRKSCSQSGGILSLDIKNVGDESQACYLISNIGYIGPGEDSTIKVDFRANVSGVKAQGAWFAGWVYPKGVNPDDSHPAEDNNPASGAEFDVFEYMPTWGTAYNTAIHDGGSEEKWIYGDLLSGIDLTDNEFHTYSMEWNKDCVVFSIDGIATRSSNSPLISSAKKHAIYLSMEAQTGVQWALWPVGDFQQNLNDNPSTGKIDWVSVSRKNSIDANLCDIVLNDNPIPEEDPQTTTDYREVCNSTDNGTSCTLPDGTYQVINHTTGERYPSVVVPNSTIPDPDSNELVEPMVVGNVLSWPSDGWWQVQTTTDYREVCSTSSHGTSCILPDGSYQVINHTTGDRYPNIIVPQNMSPRSDPEADPEPSGVTDPIVEGNVLSWPSEGWWQVQTTTDYREVCNSSNDGTSCTLPNGTYQVINHTTGLVAGTDKHRLQRGLQFQQRRHIVYLA